MLQNGSIFHLLQWRCPGLFLGPEDSGLEDFAFAPGRKRSWIRSAAVSSARLLCQHGLTRCEVAVDADDPYRRNVTAADVLKEWCVEANPHRQRRNLFVMPGNADSQAAIWCRSFFADIFNCFVSLGLVLSRQYRRLFQLALPCWRDGHH